MSGEHRGLLPCLPHGLVSDSFRPLSRGQHLCLRLSAAWLQGQLLRQEGCWGAGPPMPPPPGPRSTPNTLQTQERER